MRRWQATVALPLILLAATALAAYAGFHADREGQRAREDAAATRSAATVNSLTDGLISRIQDVAGLFGASQHVSSDEFETFGRTIVSTSEASSIGWAPVVIDAERARFERANDLEVKVQSPEGELVRAPRKERYVVATYAVRRNDRPGTLGLDLTSTPDREKALARSSAAGTPVATPPIRLVDGTVGFAMYMPVYGKAGLNASTTPIGYAVGSFRVADLATSLQQRLSVSDGLVLSHGGKPMVEVGTRDPDSDVVTRVVGIAGQSWEISSWVPSAGIGIGVVALVVGLLVTLLVSLLVFLIWRSGQHSRALAEGEARERELKLAIEERRSAAAEERFERVFDSSNLGMALTDLDGHFVRVNKAFCELVDRTESGLLGQTPELITHPDDVAAAMQSLASLASGEAATVEGDRRYLTPSGEVVWVALRAIALTGADGEVEFVLAQALDISERQAAEERLKHIAAHDTLTGLPNRRAFDQALAHHMSLGRRYDPDGALLIFDLDNFKQINDRLGHQEGDAMLRRVAEALRAQLRDSDIAGRIGGDEFAVLLPRGSASDVEIVADRLVANISAVGKANHVDGLRDLTCSLGIALLAGGTHSVEEVVQQADQAMYAAKDAGGNRFVLLSDGPAPATT